MKSEVSSRREETSALEPFTQSCVDAACSKRASSQGSFAFIMLHVIDYLVQNSTAQISVKPANKVK